MKKSIWILSAIAVVLIAGCALFVSYPVDGRVDVDQKEPLDIERFYFDRFEIAQVYFQRSSWVSERLIPYKDVLQEYPQLGVLYISLPRLFTDEQGAFTAGVVLMNVLCWAGTVFVLLKFIKKLSLHWTRVLILLLPSFLYFAVARYDIFPAALVLTSLFLLVSNRFRSAIIILTLAIFAKWYALLLIPFFFAYAASMGVPQVFRKQAMWILVSVSIGIMGVTFAVAGLSTLYPYGVHLERSAEIGGLYTVCVEILLSLLPVSSRGFVIGLLEPLFFGIQFLGLIVGTLFYRLISKMKMSFDTPLRIAVLAIGVFVLAGKFYSGQWELWWIIPAALIVRGTWQWMLLVLIDVSNYIQVPLLYKTIGPFSFISDSVVLVRSMLFIVLLMAIARPLLEQWVNKERTRPTDVIAST